MDKLDDRRHSQRQRVVFIDFCLFFLGELKRQDIVDRFDVGPAVATRDIALYKNDLGGKVLLNPSTKIYEPEEDFEPLFEHKSDRVLATLSQGFGEFGREEVNAIIPSEIPYLLNYPSLEALAPLSRAIHKRQVVRIQYNSFSSGARARDVVPFALVNNGMRWHVRAYDRYRQRFGDFVLTRVQEAEVLVGEVILTHERPEQDVQWTRQIEMTLVPHPDRAHPEIIAMDYGMTDNKLCIKVRAAMAGYFLRQWNVDCSRRHKLKGEDIRLWLSNPLALYNVETAKLAPGYETPQ
ncbi:MAG: WYL domain-containing protein [Agitococcus sp.]|nr:WYL domain-containing protein [Agitococcus sp.]